MPTLKDFLLSISENAPRVAPAVHKSISCTLTGSNYGDPYIPSHMQDQPLSLFLDQNLPIFKHVAKPYRSELAAFLFCKFNVSKQILVDQLHLVGPNTNVEALERRYFPPVTVPANTEPPVADSTAGENAASSSSSLGSLNLRSPKDESTSQFLEILGGSSHGGTSAPCPYEEYVWSPGMLVSFGVCCYQVLWLLLFVFLQYLWIKFVFWPKFYFLRIFLLPYFLWLRLFFKQQQRNLRISLRICGTVVESLPAARCAPKCEKTVQALLCRNLNVKLATLLNAVSSRRIRLQDDIVTRFNLSVSERFLPGSTFKATIVELIREGLVVLRKVRMGRS